MKVRDVMTVDMHSCPPEANLAEVAQVMWERDCGIVPVVDSDSRVGGVLTDRDVCIALGTRNLPAAEVRASDVMSTNVITSSVDADLEAALATMHSGRVRRVPVVDAGGKLCGILSLDDVVLRVTEKPKDGKLRNAMVGTLKAICEKGQSPYETVPV
ncbi:MAG: CBS domain-containing protein [Vicinamibacterales bacterium]